MKSVQSLKHRRAAMQLESLPVYLAAACLLGASSFSIMPAFADETEQAPASTMSSRHEATEQANQESAAKPLKSAVPPKSIQGNSAQTHAHARAVTSSHKQDLHQTLQRDVKEQGTTPKQQDEAAKTAAALNKLPGEKVNPKDLEHPPIKGFHPIKKLFQPLDNLEQTADKLNVESTKLEKPMTDLQEPMVHLQKKMVTVDKKVIQMHKTLNTVSDEVTGARKDLSSIREEMNDLKGPIVQLQKPITGVANPLEQIQLKLSMLLLFIFIFMMIVSFGTPLAAIMIYRNRSKLFPSSHKPAAAGTNH